MSETEVKALRRALRQAERWIRKLATEVQANAAEESQGEPLSDHPGAVRDFAMVTRARAAADRFAALARGESPSRDADSAARETKETP